MDGCKVRAAHLPACLPACLASGFGSQLGKLLYIKARATERPDCLPTCLPTCSRLLARSLACLCVQEKKKEKKGREIRILRSRVNPSQPVSQPGGKGKGKREKEKGKESVSQWNHHGRGRGRTYSTYLRSGWSVLYIPYPCVVLGISSSLVGLGKISSVEESGGEWRRVEERRGEERRGE